MRDDELDLLRGWLAANGRDWGPPEVARGLDLSLIHI